MPYLVDDDNQQVEKVGAAKRSREL